MNLALEPSPLSLGPPLRPVLPRLAKAESMSTETAGSAPSTVSDPPSSTVAASIGLPQLLPVHLPQPIYVEGRPLDEVQSFTASEKSTAITLPPLEVPRPAYAEAKFIAPDLSAGPSMLYRLDVLGEAFMPRDRDSEQFKVVAVDGTNKNAVHLLIARLSYQIRKDLKYTVRVVHENHQIQSTYPANAVTKYLEEVRNWGLMWVMMLRRLSIRTSTERSVRPAVNPATSYPYPLVYILPLSPLMATLEASRSIDLAHHPQDQLWRWLAGHWAGHLRPDITVVLQESHNSMVDQEVLRIEGKDMRTLLVTNATSGAIDLTPAQLRRITFETEEWLDTVS